MSKLNEHFFLLCSSNFVRHLAVLAKLWATFRLLNICVHSAHKYTNILMGDFVQDAVVNKCIFCLVCFLFKGTLDIQFIESSDNVRLEEGDVYQMVESTSYFEACRHVLNRLQAIHPTEFPFQVRVIPPL